LEIGETRLITPFWEEPPDRSGNIKVYHLLAEGPGVGKKCILKKQIIFSLRHP